MEARVQLLETTIVGQQKQIELLNKTKDARDDIVVSLFKMPEEQPGKPHEND